MRMMQVVARMAPMGDHLRVIDADRDCRDCLGAGLRFIDDGETVASLAVCHCVAVRRGRIL